MKNKIFLFPISLAVIFFASIIIIFSPVGKKTIIPLPTSTISPTSAPTQTPTSTIDTSTWKIYTNTKDLFTLNYPEDWKKNTVKGITYLSESKDCINLAISSIKFSDPNVKNFIATHYFKTYLDDPMSNITGQIEENYKVIDGMGTLYIPALDMCGSYNTFFIKDQTVVNIEKTFPCFEGGGNEELSNYCQSIDTRNLTSQILLTFKFISPAITKQIGYIKNAYFNNLFYIDIDYIEWIEDNSAPNGFRIKNDNPQIRTFEIIKSAPISLIDLTGPEISLQKVTFDNLIINLKKTNYLPFWISLNSSNQVIEIKEQYVP